MGSVFTLALFLFVAPLEPLELLQIELQDQVFAIMDREDYTLPFSGVPLVDPDRLEQLIEQVAQQVYQPPINAQISPGGAILPEKMGRALDRRHFAREVYDFFYGKGSNKLEVRLQAVHPKVDRALLEQVRKKTIGFYITYYNSGNKNRSHNIKLASTAINNYIVLPGEVFSFNKVVGKRTRAKGYLDAPIIVRGELSEGIGGGICQVSSTLYNAVDKAGLHIIERYSHSRNVAYVPPGRDATVSWYGPDFVFQNKYAYPILVRAGSGGGSMYVSIHSFPEIEYEPRHVPSVRNQTPEEGPAPILDESSLTID